MKVRIDPRRWRKKKNLLLACVCLHCIPGERFTETYGVAANHKEKYSVSHIKIYKMLNNAALYTVYDTFLYVLGHPVDMYSYSQRQKPFVGFFLCLLRVVRLTESAHLPPSDVAKKDEEKNLKIFSRAKKTALKVEL